MPDRKLLDKLSKHIHTSNKSIPAAVQEPVDKLDECANTISREFSRLLSGLRPFDIQSNHKLQKYLVRKADYYRKVARDMTKKANKLEKRANK